MEPLEEIQVPLNVGTDGRMTLDKDHREALGIDGQRAYCKVTIEPLRIDGEPAEETRGCTDGA